MCGGFCYDPVEFDEIEINGECPDCEEQTVDGLAWRGCKWSSVICETCGYSPCDDGC